MTMVSDNQRIEYFDLAKGICIILVVLYHGYVLTSEVPMLGSLRMPLYFFLSGLFFKPYGRFSEFVIRKTDRLLIPMLFFIVIGAIMRGAGYIMRFGELAWTEYCADFLTRIKPDYGFGFVPTNYVLWFLGALFMVNLLFYLVSRIPGSVWNRHAATAFLCGIGVWASTNVTGNPLYLNSALMGLPYFWFGHISSKIQLCSPGYKAHWSIPIGLSLIVIAIAISFCSGNSHLGISEHNIYGNSIAAYITPFFAVPGILFISKAIVRVPIVSYLGRYSIIVLGLHDLFLASFFELFSFPSAISLRLVAVGFSLTMCLAMIPVLRRYVPRFTAQADLIQPLAARLRAFRLAKSKA